MKRVTITLAQTLLLALPALSGTWQDEFRSKYHSANHVLAEVGGELYAAGQSSHWLSGKGRFVFSQCLKPAEYLVLSFGDGQDDALMKRMRLYTEGDAGYAAKLTEYKSRCWGWIKGP